MNFSGFNGIRNHGERNTDRLNEPLERLGHQFYDIAIPRRGVLSSNWYTARKDAREALNQFEGRDIRAAVSHSRGATVLVKVAEQHAFDLLIFSRPAMRRNYPINKFKGNPTVICLWSDGDFVVKLGGFVPLSIFGRAGSHGMKTPGVINVEMFGGHNEDFEGDQFLELIGLCDDTLATLASLGDRVAYP